MGEVVYIQGKPYDPNQLYLYYYNRYESSFFAVPIMEEGQKLRPYDVNGDRVISYKELRDKLKLVELAYFPGTRLILASNAKEAIGQIPSVRWLEAWTPRRSQHKNNAKWETPPHFADGISPQAKRQIKELREKGIDINRDGFADRFEWTSTVTFGYKVSLWIYWGSKEGFSKRELIKTFELGDQVTEIHWDKNSSRNDFGSFLVSIAPTQWMASWVMRISALNAPPPKMK